MKSPILLIFAFGVVATAAASESLRSTIESANKKIVANMLKRDFAGLEKVMKSSMTPDFKYIEEGRTMSFQDMFSMLKQGMGQYTKMVETKSILLTLKEKGITATSTSRHTQAGMMPGPDQKDHKMVFVGISTDTYKKVKGKWLMSSMSMKTESMTLDGKPFNPAKVAGL